MQCYTELTPPTAVTHSLVLPLTSARGSNLVVAKASLLQVFATRAVPADQDAQAAGASSTGQAPYVASTTGAAYGDEDALEASFLGSDAALVRADRGTRTKLVLVAEFPLAGTVTGLARIKLAGTKTGGEALLLAFKDARLSLVEWDAERHELATISIHYYEQDELQGAPWAPPLSDYSNVLVADPGSRCAALKFGARNLAILPFRQADEEEDIDMADGGEGEGEGEGHGGDDWDESLDGPRPAKTGGVAGAAAASAVVSDRPNGTIEDTPFVPSFVLRLSNLDAALLHPVHLAFLYEYREPTFGILSAAQAPSAVLGRRDILSYMVFTLDLQQKASTTILSVPGLPQDLFYVFPILPPIGGALLVGTNELIHIDQSGRANGVAVNTFTKQCTSFGLADQSDLGLKLEGCQLEMLSPEAGEILLVLNDGRLALVTLHVDGRSVSGISIQLVSQDAGSEILPTGVASLSRMGRQVMFAGSEQSDSVVFGWSRKQGPTARKKGPRGDMSDDVNEMDGAEEENDEDDSVDDDDLYGDGPSMGVNADGDAGSVKTGGGVGASGDLTFRVHDTLLSIAPIRDMTFGEPLLDDMAAQKEAQRRTRSDLNLACAVGQGRAGALALLSREINPETIGVFSFPEAHALWTVYAAKPMPKTRVVGEDYASPVQYDKFMIVAMEDEDGFETSNVYAVSATGFEKLTGTEFEPAAGFTVHAATMGQHKRIIQVLKSELRCYDGDLGLAQILPMIDEDTGAEFRVVSASIADPYILVIRDDASALVAEMNKDLELEELEVEDETFKTAKWAAGCLYHDTAGVFTKSLGTEEAILAFLLSRDGTFHILSLPSLTPLYAVDGLCYVPPLLSPEYTARRGTAKETVAELVVADLGDVVHASPYLLVRHANDDLTIYEPIGSSSEKGLRFLKCTNTAFAKAAETAPSPSQGEDVAPVTTGQLRGMPLRVFRNIGGYSAVFLPGTSPSFVLKTAQTMPKVVGLCGTAVRSLSSFHTEGCERGFIYVDGAGTSRVCTLPRGTNMTELGVCVDKVALGAEVEAVAFHPPARVYVVATSQSEAFELPKDDTHRTDMAKESIGFQPQTARSTLHLVAGTSGWQVVDKVALEANEVVLCMQTLTLEVSEATNERWPLVVVGTAISKGEDLAVKGRVHVFDVVSVIPEPGRPETSRRLKRVAQEDIPRGAVTALSAVGTQGLMLVAQGQKCLVRGLKEDGTLLPVAFLDMNCYVTSVKELPGTGLCVMADAFKGVWFTGYTEEPYRMVLFGKSHTRLEAVNVDLLPDGNELYIVAADTDGNLQVLQFDPEHPKSLQGHLLLHRATFCTGAHTPTSSLLLPSTVFGHARSNTAGELIDNDDDDDAQRQHLLLASPTGVLAALAPLSESEYRQLSSLAGQLTTSLAHTAGLNPKGYRMVAGAGAAVVAPGVDAAVGRSVVDGTMLARWAELGSGRRGEIAGRVGFANAQDVRAVLSDVLGWARMAYF